MLKLEHGFTETGGVRLHYVHAGKGKAIIFQPGFAQAWFDWQKQLEEFSRDHLAAAVDMPGFNESDKPPEVEKYRMRNLVNYFNGVVEQLGVESFTLVGNDLNGFCWVYAALCPERLERLVVINSPHPNVIYREWTQNPVQKEASQYVLRIQSPEGEKYLSDNDFAVIKASMDLELLVKRGNMGPEDVKRTFDLLRQPGTLTAYCNYYRAGPAYGLRDDVKPSRPMVPLMISTPTLIIWGMKNRAVLPGLLEGLDEYVPNVKIIRLEEGTHQVVRESPELLNRYIREFISG